MSPWAVQKLIALISCIITAEGGFTLEQGIPHFNTKPYFLASPATNVTAVEGQSAYLHCRVAQLGDKKVSWIRRRDLHVLTSGLLTFASDERFQALHAERSENWTLHIRFTQERDSGAYQCQVNTEPRISMFFMLTVAEAQTTMEGSDQRYVREGSAIKLKCSTGTSSEQPGLLYWYRDAEMLKEGGNIAMNTTFEGSVSSELTIQNAAKTDSGNYTCWPTKFNPASTMVHVIPDEETAAMSHGTVSGGGSASGGGTSVSSTCKMWWRLPNVPPLLSCSLVLLSMLIQSLQSHLVYLCHYQSSYHNTKSTR